MNKLNLKIGSIIGQNNFKELVNICRLGVEKISDLGPSDNNVELDMQHQGQKFLVTLRMASGDLMFTLVNTSNSPFMAVENVVKEGLEKVHKWSLKRHIDPVVEGA